MFQRWTRLLPEAVALLILASINIALQIWENYKRVNELPVKIEKTIEISKGPSSLYCKLQIGNTLQFVYKKT